MNKDNNKGQALYRIFESHIGQLNQNGLSIIDAATGYGKTTQSGKYIVNNCKNKKFIFLAPQKKLLINFEQPQIDQMKNLLGENPIIIKIYPAYDTFVENFTSIINDEIFSCISNTSVLSKIINGLKKQNNIENELYKNLFSQEEQIFRKELKDILINKKEFKNIYKKDIFDKRIKKDILLFFDRHKWIAKLYPSVLLPYANIVEMTIQKAYYSIDTLWYGQHELSNKYDNLFKEYIIFIDEFDSTKESLLKLMISNITNQDRLNLFKSITYIYNSLKNICENNVLPLKIFGDKIDIYRSKIFAFYDSLKQDYTKYHLDATLKFNHDNTKDQFLFRDKDVLDVFDGNEREKLFIKFDCLENYNVVYKAKEGSIRFEEVSFLISRIMDEFMILVAEIAKNFFEYKKLIVEKGEEVYSLYDSISTILNELNIGKENEEYFSKVVYKYLTFNLKFKIEKNDEFLDTGFKYFFLENKPSHDLSTNVYYYHYNELPEHFLIGIAQNNIVIGMSATATLETYVKNYDMHYLSKTLGEHFIQINPTEIEELKKDFKENKKTNVNVKVVQNEEDLSILNFNERLKNIDLNYESINVNWNEVFVIDEVIGDKQYRLETYYNLLEAFNIFCENNIHGMICFLNFKIISTSELNFINFKAQLERISKLKGNECKVFLIDSNNFDNEYEKVKLHLKDGNAFIISTYQTLSLGKNLQYEFNGEKRDLDGIYLDKISYVMPSVEKNNNITLAEYLYNLEYLKSEGIIKKRDKFISYIKEGFNKFLGLNKEMSIDRDAINAKDAIMSKAVIQSIGRLCRTENKADDIFIVVHQKIKEALKRKTCELKERMINYEFKELLNTFSHNNFNLMNKRIIIDNEENNKSANKKITYLSFNWWNDLKKAEWLNLREMVLKYPTVANVTHETCIYYYKFEEKINSYVYQEKHLSNKKIEIYNISNSSIADKYTNKVNITTSRFSEMLKSKYVYDYCKNKGYALQFEANNYILNPGTFQRIYKGAIGEIAARAILEAHGVIIKEITNNKYFEKFDYYNGNIYYDMKNWSQGFYKNKEEMLHKVHKKAIKCGAKRVFIINVLKNNFSNSHINIFKDQLIYEIPWLYDSVNDIYNIEAIKFILEEQIYDESDDE